MPDPGAVWQAIDQLDSQLWNLALRIHAHPELGFEEHQAAEWMTAALEEAGFCVDRGVAGLATAFRAVHPAEQPGPAVAVFAEYDALPEIGHACGHNLIATMALGAALGLAAVKDLLPGRLVVFGSPAEEGGGGKIIMSQAGLFREIDAALIVHPASYTAVELAGLAIAKRDTIFHGKPAHAASHPDKGVNALDAVIQTFNGINAMRQHIQDGARVHGVVTEGGLRPNIVPERAAAQFYVRAAQNAYRDELVEKLHGCARGAALATGASLEWETVGYDCQAVLPNHALSEAFTRHLATLGMHIDPLDPGLGSTDMGNVSWEVPSIHPFIRIVGGQVAGHTREFAAAACAEPARSALLIGAKAMAATALDLWLDGELMRAVKEEFVRTAQGQRYG